VKYTIGSRELMNVFLKGLHTAPDIVERVIDKSLVNYYNLKEKMITVVKNRQLLNAMKRSMTTLAFQRPFQCYDNHRPPPQFNSSNAPCSMNNIPVPMDLSRGRSQFNQRGGQPGGSGQWQGARGNIAQADQQFPRAKGPCFKCRKDGHFAWDCRSIRAHYINYMDQSDNMSQLQEAITPENILDNAIRMFDTLPLDQKDAFIQKYEGGQEDFAEV